MSSGGGSKGGSSGGGGGGCAYPASIFWKKRFSVALGTLAMVAKLYFSAMAIATCASGAPPTAEELTRMLGAFSGSGDSALPRLFKVPMPPAQKPTLAFYRDGFTVTAGCSEPSCTHDDSAGPCPEHVPQTTTFRSLATAETARFLREICEGTRPRELRGVGGFWVRDERHADLPEDAFQAFSGSGQKLGNVQGALPPAAPPMMAGVAAALRSMR